MINFFKSYINKDKIQYFFVGFLPFVLFLNKNNLPQLEAEEIQVIFFFTIVFFGVLLFKFFLKSFYKNINLDNFLTIIFVIYYFSFFYTENLTKNLQDVILSGYYFSAFIFSIIIILIFFIMG